MGPPPSLTTRASDSSPVLPLLECTGIEKSFHGVRVLRAVSFALARGRTLGLVGENGAGKSTLMNILGGNLVPDAGQLHLGGQEYRPRDPRDAAAHGVAFIHQELNLFTNLSVAENIFLTAFPRWPRPGMPFIHRRRIRAQTRALLDQVDLAVSPDTLVDQWPPG
jgi:ribose transport system ATP-binding protein